MNLTEMIVESEKAVKTKNILNGNGVATLINIKKNSLLDNHQSKVNALLILLSGEVLYEEADRSVSLAVVHDIVEIPEKVTHRVSGKADSLLLLIQ